MTTVGVRPSPSERILPMNVPSYCYHYPSLSTVKLAAVKEGLFHPNIPTFRRMDMDTAGHKLPDEHCRTTTSCGPGERLDKVIYNVNFYFISWKDILPCYQLSPGTNYRQTEFKKI